MRTLVVLGLAAMLAGCGFGNSVAPDRYQLTPKPVAARACHGAPSIKFYTPNVAPGIDTARIVVMDRPNHLTVYRGVVWSATASRLVQHYLSDSIEQSGMFSTVSSDLDTLPADYEVESELREFHVDLTGEPSVRIRLSVTVTRADGQRIMKSVVLRRATPIGAAKMDGIVALFAEDMHHIAQELQQQLARTIPGCRA